MAVREGISEHSKLPPELNYSGRYARSHRAVGFDPVRREIARLSPSVGYRWTYSPGAEEVVNKSVSSWKKKLLKWVNVPPSIWVFMDFIRTHSFVGKRNIVLLMDKIYCNMRETANLCATMAAELGLNVKKPKSRLIA